PSKYIVRGGDRIVGAHEVVTSEAHEKLVALHHDLVRRGAATSRSAGGVLGPILRDSLIFAIFWVLMVFYRRETYRERRQVALIGGVVALVLVQAGGRARLRARPAAGGGRGALRPEPSRDHRPALHGDVAHRVVQRAGLDDRRHDSRYR